MRSGKRNMLGVIACQGVGGLHACVVEFAPLFVVENFMAVVGLGEIDSGLRVGNVPGERGGQALLLVRLRRALVNSVVGRHKL